MESNAPFCSQLSTIYSTLVTNGDTRQQFTNRRIIISLLVLMQKISRMRINNQQLREEIIIGHSRESYLGTSP
jgi:hypothetical protein